MLRLNQRAHAHLQEDRERKISPVQSTIPYRPFHEGTPDAEHEDDELAKLGGKTRLISQKDPSKSPSPAPHSLVTRSPNTHNPIVPLPLHGVHTTHMDPTVVDYLQTFQPYGGMQQGSSSGGGAQNGGISDDYTMYTGSENVLHNAGSMTYNGSSSVHFNANGNGLQSLATVAAAAAASDMAPSPSSAGSSNGPGLPPMLQTSVPSSTQNYFPQYFPVFDYGTGSANGSNNNYSQLQLQTPVSAGGYDHAMNLDGMNMNGHVQSRTAYLNPPQHDRRESMTPDTSMHTTWMDFVNQMSVMQ